MSQWHFLVLATVLAAPLQAQNASLAEVQDTSMLVKPKITSTLMLSDAVLQARANNPDYKVAQNALSPANEGVKNAYGQFIPFVSTNGGVNYQGSGHVIVQGETFDNPAFWASSYGLNISWLLSGPTIFGPAQAKANKRAAAANIDAARIQVDADVITQYLTGLQAAATTEVARQQLRRNSEFLVLTSARNRVGQASMYDVRQAEVAYNQSEVDLLKSLQAESDSKIELFRRMGVAPPAPVAEVALTDTFPVRKPNFDLQALLSEARTNEPRLKTLQAREDQANATLKSAKSAFFPTLSAFANVSGYTQQFTNTNELVDQAQSRALLGAQACRDNNVIRANVALSTVPDCNAALGLNSAGTALNPSVQQAILDENNTFPFHFTANPFVGGLQITLPIFQGFNRSLRVSQAKADKQDAGERYRALDLQISADVTSRLLAVETTYRTIDIQDQSRTSAREQLTLATERYRLGSGTVLELSDALNAVTRADAAYINAVYDNHRALVALYASVGRDYTVNARN